MTEAAIAYPVRVSPLSRRALAVVADDLPDPALTVDELGSRIVGMSGRLASAMCRWLLLVAAFDARDGAAKFCLASTARWLGHYCGLSARTAREHVRAARCWLGTRCWPTRSPPGGSPTPTCARSPASPTSAVTGWSPTWCCWPNTAPSGSSRTRSGGCAPSRRTTPATRAFPSSGDPPVTEAVSHRWREDSHLGLSAKLDPEHGALLLSAVNEVARRETSPRPRR